MENSLLAERLRNGEIVYLYDEYEDAIVKLAFDNKENITEAWIKRKDKKEKKIPQSEPIVLDIIMGGIEVSKDYYDNY